MPIFKQFADTAARSIVNTMGELILLVEQPSDDNSEAVEIIGIFDETITQNSDVTVDVLIQQPNVIFRDDDIEGIKPKNLMRSRTLNRRGWVIIRPFTGRSYEIADINRDETTTTQYLLREI